MTCSESLVKIGTMSKAKITSRCSGHGISYSIWKNKRKIFINRSNNLTDFPVQFLFPGRQKNKTSPLAPTCTEPPCPLTHPRFGHLRSHKHHPSPPSQPHQKTCKNIIIQGLYEVLNHTILYARSC